MHLSSKTCRLALQISTLHYLSCVYVCACACYVLDLTRIHHFLKSNGTNSDSRTVAYVGLGTAVAVVACRAHSWAMKSKAAAGMVVMPCSAAHADRHTPAVAGDSMEPGKVFGRLKTSVSVVALLL